MDRVLLALQQIISAEVALQASNGNGPLRNIKKVYYGDPIQIPEANLPAIALQPMLTPYTQRGSRYDEKQCTIEVRIVVNRKDYYNDTGSPDDTVLVVKAMVESLEKMNAGKDVSHQSIAGIVQSNPCLKYTDPQDLLQKNACSLARIDQVVYRFSQDRGFPTYEGVASVLCRVIGDR